MTWAPARATDRLGARVPLPSRLGIGPTIGVVGRERESDLLADAFKRVAAGDGREVVLVSGEPGMGKTTLTAHFARAAFDAGACVLLGRGDEDLGAPYGPFVEVLRHLITHAPEDLLAAHVQAQGPELARIVPTLKDRLTTLPAAARTDPETERYILYGAVVELLARASASAPVVVVLDDLQWADKPSLQLLRHIISVDTSARLLIVATYRDTELSAAHPLTETLAALRREHGVNRIDLKGLDDTGVVAFMEAAAGHDLDDIGVGLAHALYRETDGNPFFVGEVLRNLSETGAIYQDDTGRWLASTDPADLALPNSVREVIGSRVARLGERARRVLSFASVIGRDFDLELLAQVTETTEDEVLDILDAAATVALLHEVPDQPGHYTYSHALIQHTLYQDLGATRRAKAHHRVAEALEAICGNEPGERLGELAHHFFSATQPVDVDKAMAYSRRAGEAALEALAPDDAVRYFSQALRLHTHIKESDPLLHTDLLLGLGNAQRQAGVPAFRETLLDAARMAEEHGLGDRLVGAALANNRGFFTSLGAIDADKVEVIEEALRALGRDDDADRALLLATLCNELSFGPLERRLALAEEAKDIARRVGDAVTRVKVLNTVHQTALLVPTLLDERVSDSSEAFELAAELGDPVQRFWAADISHMSALTAGDFERHAACFAEMQRLSERLRQPMLTWVTTFHEAANALLTGDPDRAESLANDALQVGTDSGQPDAFAFYGTQLLGVRQEQGRLGELTSLIAQLASDNPRITAYHAALCLAHLEAGESVEALELLHGRATNGFASVNHDTAWMDAMANYAKTAIELQAAGPAVLLMAVLEPFHDQIPFEGLLSQEPIATHLGGLAAVLGLHDRAEAYLEEAAALNSRGDMRFAEAYTNLLWGRMLRTRGGPGDAERARALLEQARSSADTRGYATVERRARAELSNLT